MIKKLPQQRHGGLLWIIWVLEAVYRIFLVYCTFECACIAYAILGCLFKIYTLLLKSLGSESKAGFIWTENSKNSKILKVLYLLFRYLNILLLLFFILLQVLCLYDMADTVLTSYIPIWSEVVVKSLTMLNKVTIVKSGTNPTSPLLLWIAGGWVISRIITPFFSSMDLYFSRSLVPESDPWGPSSVACRKCDKMPCHHEV